MADIQLDGAKLAYHPQALLAWQRGEFVPPILVEISPTNLCNHRCEFCAYDYLERTGSYLDIDRMKPILSELKTLGSKALFYSGEGEPLVHKRLPELIDYASDLGFDQALNTNGSRLLPNVTEQIMPHISWVRLSINGVDREDYALHHRVSARQFDLVMENLTFAAEFIKQQKLPTALGIQFVYLGQPPDAVIEMAQRMKAIGVRYFAVKQFNKHPSIPFSLETQPPIEALSPLEALSDEGFQATLRLGALEWQTPREYRHCLALPFFAEIVANGDVYACGPHLGNPDFCYGSIHEQSFTQLWSQTNRQKVEDHVHGIANLDAVCMPNCRLHAINQFLWNLASPPDHINFI